MRLWHYKLLPYLPDAQFKGQLRELMAIMHDWRDKGKTNHLLINRVMQHPKDDLTGYATLYAIEYENRCGKKIALKEFIQFSDGLAHTPPFEGWHNTEYLRVCMANLYEKHHFGVGKSRITDDEWKRLCEGYKTITGEDYKI